MDCEQTSWLGNDEYFRQFNRKIAQGRVPIYGSLALTHRCNLSCAHCYLAPQTRARSGADQELSARQIIPIMDEFTEAGCLFVLLTGGEPLLHRDFCEIYRRAKTNGLVVNIFTNGTRITDEILDVFADLPPHAVEITLYGATAETYEKITGVAGSYRRCIEGIEGLLDRKISVKLKTMLMTLNRHEFFDIQTMAANYGVGFRFDAAIFPRFDGDRTPVQLRVSAKEAVEKEFSDERRLGGCREYFKAARGLRVPDTLYACGAGQILFHIEPDGKMTPCLMTPGPAYDLLSGRFATGWQEIMPRIKERKAPRDYRCSRCDVRALCNICPAFFRLENGSELCYSTYLCAMARYRFKTIRDETLVAEEDRKS